MFVEHILSADNQEFDALEKAIKILQLNEKDGLSVKLKWFNHLPIQKEKYVPDELKKENYPYCMNYPLIKVEHKEYAKNCYNNDIIFDDYFGMDDINKNIGLTNEIKPYLMLIDVFKEMTKYLEGHCTVDDINEIGAYLNNKIVEEGKKSSR